jgi:hypothetical protein
MTAGSFDLSGAQLQSSFWYGGAATYWARVRGSAQVDTSSSVFLQFDGNINSLAFGNVTGEAAAHVGVEASPDVSLGAFAGAAVWSSGPQFATFGAEAVAHVDNLTIEAYGAHVRDFGGTWWENHTDVMAMYDFGGNVSVGVGGHYMWDNTAGNFYQFRAAARYALADDMYVEGSYAYTNPNWTTPMHSVGLMFVKTFDKGVTFGSRDYAALWNRY